ncbi:MAG: transcriptional regulator TbsP [Halodesulfurarchaeum sp.]
MNSNLLGTDVTEVLRSLLVDEPDVVYVVNPNRAILERVIDAVCSTNARTDVRAIGDRSTLKEVFEDFIIASHVADLIENGNLGVRSIPDYERTPVFVTPDRVTALLEAESHIGGLSTAEGGFPETLFATIEHEWNTAEQFELRTPARSRITETLEESLGNQVRADFEATLDGLESLEQEGSVLDEVSISLLVAAKNEVLLYDISKWGEDVGIASKATFSRTKTKLEDYGVIDTEKVPIDVGRPRLRLKLHEDAPSGDDPIRLVEFARSALQE